MYEETCISGNGDRFLEVSEIEKSLHDKILLSLAIFIHTVILLSLLLPNSVTKHSFENIIKIYFFYFQSSK